MYRSAGSAGVRRESAGRGESKSRARSVESEVGLQRKQPRGVRVVPGRGHAPGFDYYVRTDGDDGDGQGSQVAPARVARSSGPP